MMKHIALLLVGAAALANAGPVSRESSCATICDIAQTKFAFETGKTYIYDYEGETVTKIEGASEEVSGLHIKTTARINVISPCEYTLELRGTELSHLAPNDGTTKTASPVAGAFKSALEANPIRFGMNNGKGERVCGTTKDASWILNVKRGIISALQNNMADLKTETQIRETDVVGTCQTTYKPMADGSIMKTKNLLGCIDREYMNTMIQHTHYNVPSDFQGVPFLKSEHACKQTITKGTVVEVTCTESHIARAFSNGEAGAATTLKTKLTFKRAVTESMTARPVTFTAPITFDSTKTEREITDAAKFVTNAIREICAANHAEDKSPERFSKLIKNVQALDAVTLTKLHQSLVPTTCKLGKKTFHDVLPLAGTAAAVSVMKDVLLAKQIDGVEADMWKSALAFIPNPNEEMIAHVTPLLATPDSKVYLSTSTMVRHFCQKRTDCAAVKEVQDFIKVLEARIGTDCSGNEDVVLMSLKAIGNAGVSMAGRPALIQCIKNEKVGMDLRIAALEAFRHMKLGATKTDLLAIYKNMDLDPEIRIGAFVALMRDPCKMCIDTVQATMAKERVLQVGSFVMSFMENARRSENPAKKEVNAVLRMFDETKIKRDWNLERMKYSRAYEASYFSSYLNAGIDAESQVIFSPAGFLPRQIKTDLNINLFGRSIDLMEIGARMEGLENLLEYYFGPAGPLAETGVGRTKRAAIDKEGLDKIHNKVKSQSQITKEARGLMYLKMFGSELGYLKFDMESLLEKKNGINVLEMLKSIARNHEQEYTQNFQLLDMTYIVPTVLGLPLKLDLNAHGTMHLKVGGKLDIVKLMTQARNMDIDGHIKPSAAIEVNTQMGIDAFLTQTGIKMVANLHTSTSIEGKIMLKGGKIFKVHYAVPKTEQEIFHGMTKFFVKLHETEREQRMITKDAISMEKCTGSTLATITGLEMCGEVRLPNAAMIKTAPYFPLTGPVNMRLAIHKRDEGLTSFDFEASRTSENGVESMKLILDTPKSTINRELATIITLNTIEKSLDFDIRSPWKKVHAEAALVNTADLHKLTTKLTIDETKEYSAAATVAMALQNDIIEYTPGLEVIANGKNLLKAGGKVIIQKGRKLLVDLKLENLTEKPIALVATLDQVAARSLRLNHDITFTSPLMTLAAKGFIEKQQVKLILRSENSFQFRNGKEHKMTLDAKLHSEKKRDLSLINFSGNLDLSDFPEHNLGLKINFKKEPTTTKFDAEATFRKDIKPVKFMNTLDHKLTAPVKIGMKSELILPMTTFKMEHKLDQLNSNEYAFTSVTNWAAGREAKAEFTLALTPAEGVTTAELRGKLMAPFIPTVTLLVRPVISKTSLNLFTELKYAEHGHSFALTATKGQNNRWTLNTEVTIDGVKHTIKMEGRVMPNLIDFTADANLNAKSFGIVLKAALEKTALKVGASIIAPKTKLELNVSGQMTGEKVDGHIDAALNGKKVEANIDYFRKDLNLKLLANAAGLTHLGSKIDKVALQISNTHAGQDMTALVEAKADDKVLATVVLKGSMTGKLVKAEAKIAADDKELVAVYLNGMLTTDTFEAGANIKALALTVGAAVKLTKKDGKYAAVISVTLPKRTVAFEAKFAGTKGKGTGMIMVNLNKEVEGEILSYELTYEITPTKFTTGLVMKQPMYLFPLPIKVTATFEKDTKGLFLADLCIDYSLKFELKGKAKITGTGIETNVAIHTPMDGFEHMSGELIATLVNNKLTFKLGAIHDVNVLLEVTLNGMVTPTVQGLDFALKTPFKGLEMITATIKNKIEGLNVDASAEIKWGINKKVAIVFGNKVTKSGDIGGKLTVVTPIEKYETTNLEYGLNTVGDRKDLIVKFTWTNKVAEWTATVSRKPDVRGFKLDSAIKVPAIDDIKMSIDFAFTPMRMIDLNIKGSFGEKNIGLATKMARTATKIDASLVLTTPKKPEAFTIKFVFNNPNEGKNLDATLTMIIDPKKTIVLTAFVKKEEWTRADGKIEFTSFFAEKAAVEFGWHLDAPKKSLKTKIAIEYVPGKKVVSELTLIMVPQDATFTFLITTPIAPLHKIRFHLKSTGALNNHIGRTEIEFNDMMVSSDLTIKFLNKGNFETMLTINTPIRNFEKTSLAISNKPAGNTMTATTSLLLKGKTWTITSLLQGTTPADIEYTLTITTPLAGWAKLVLALSNKGKPENMLSKGAVTLGDKTVMVALTTRFVSVADMHFGIAITTPFKKLEMMKVELTHKGTLADMLTKIAVAVPAVAEKPTAVELSAKIVSPTNMEAKLTLKDYDIFATTVIPVTLSVSNRGTTLKPLITIISVSVGPKVYTLTNTLNFNGVTKMDGSLVLTTPIEKYERVGLEWSNKITEGMKEAKLTIEFQTEQKIVIDGHIKHEGLADGKVKFETALTMTTPFTVFDRAHFKLNFNGKLMDFDEIIIIELPKIRKTEIHLGHKLDLADGISHKAKFIMDCIWFSTTHIDTTFTFKDNAVTFATNFAYGLKKGSYTLAAKFIRLNGITFELTTAFKSAWTDPKSVDVAIAFAKTSAKMTLTTMLKLNEVERLNVAFEHFPGFKCVLTVTQKFIKSLPTTTLATLDVKAALPKSLIKFVATVDGAPLTTLEFAHTYAREELTVRLDATFKDLKANANVVISKPKDTILVKVDAAANNVKLVEFMTSYNKIEKVHAVTIKAVYKGKTLIDVVFKLNPEVTDAALEVVYAGENIFGLRGKLIEYNLEAHLAWLGAPLLDLHSEFSPKPLTFGILLRHKGELILNTKTALDMKDNALEAHIKWNDAPLIDIAAEIKTTPYTVALKLHYKGNMLIHTNNVLDLKAKTLKVMINVDPLLKMVLPTSESWIMTVEGSMTKRRDLTTATVTLKKAEKTIILGFDMQKSGKIDLTLRPATLMVALRTSTINLAKNINADIVMEIKKNAGLIKTKLAASINKVEQLKTVIEITRASPVTTAAAEVFIMPLGVNTGANVKLTMTDATDFEIIVIGNKANAKDTTLTFTGTYGMTATKLVFALKAVLPTRTLVLDISHVRASRTINQIVSFSWETGKKTGYSFTLSDRSKQGALIYTLNGEFTHPIRTIKYTTKVEVSPKKYFLSLDVLPDATQPTRKTSFTVDIMNDSYGEMINAKGKTTFSHPSLNRPLSMDLTLTLNRGKILMATGLVLSYCNNDRKDISASFRITKEADFHYMIVSEVKQPINFVEVRVRAIAKKTEQGLITATTTFSYLTAQRETKAITSTITLNVPTKTVEMKLETPAAEKKVTIVLVNEFTAEGRLVKLTITHADVRANAVTELFHVTLDETNRMFKLTVGQALKVDAGIHDKYLVDLSIMAKGKKILLFKTNFKDKTHMLIGTRLEWDPVLLETIKTEVPKMVAKVTDALVKTWKPVINDILADIEAKIARFRTIGWKDFEPIFAAWKKFVRTLEKDITTALNGLKQMWRRNEFYLKDATTFVLASWEKVMMSYKELEAKFMVHHKAIIAHLEKTLKTVTAHLKNFETMAKARLEWVHVEFTKIRAQIEAIVKDLKPRVEAAVREHLEWLTKEIKELIRVYEPKIKATVAKIMKTIGHIRKNVIVPFVAKMEVKMAALRVEMETKFAPLKAKLEALWIEFLAKMEEIKASGWAKTLTELQVALEAKYATTSAAIVEWVREINAKLEALVKEWEQYPQVVELKKSIDVFTAKLVWAWNYLDIPGEVAKCMDDLRMKRERFWRIIKDNKSDVLIWSPSEGILDAQLEIPIALKELAHLPKIDDFIAKMDTARRELVAHMPKINWTFMDYYYYWMPRTTSLPPFTATGVFAGNQHFFTFDGSFIEFAGDCSYVLARDFDNGEFTVIANYRRTRAGPKRNSLTVMAGDKTIEVFNSGKTVINKEVSELPVDLPEAMVKRSSIDQITIMSKKGMTVSCSLKTEICTVAISGWYFGKTGGLLGTYDYEPSDDMTNPMGKRLEDVERFANTWEVAKTCSDKTNYAKAFHKIANIKSTVSWEVCSKLFLDDSSALRPAFRNLDTTSFMNMCINDVFEIQAQGEAAMKKKACTAAAAYMEEAKLKGIMLKAPADCISCVGAKGGEVAVGDTETVTSPVNGVDTVVVFEENICNKNKRKDLLGFISTITKAYKAQGLKDNKFGLAAFGGDGVHKEPHFHTIEGELMNSDRKFVRGVRSLDFAEGTPMNFVEGAIAFAAKNYPWRTGAKRNIIVVSCSQCMDRIPPHTDLPAILMATKAQVHMLRDMELSFRGGKRAATVLGFDRTGVYTTKDTSSKTLTGDATLLAQLAVPKETCIPAIMEAEGSFFSLHQLSHGRVRDQKKLVDVISRRVAVNAAPESCQICECKVICPFTMKTSNVCKPCRK